MNLFLWLLYVHAYAHAYVQRGQADHTDGIPLGVCGRGPAPAQPVGHSTVSQQERPGESCRSLVGAFGNSVTPGVEPFGVLQVLTYKTPEGSGVSRTEVRLRVANQTLPCCDLTYHPDPEFGSFTTLKTKDSVRVTIQVTAPSVQTTSLPLLSLSGPSVCLFSCLA